MFELKSIARETGGKIGVGGPKDNGKTERRGSRSKLFVDDPPAE